MKELIDKLSSYNIFNYLFPGAIFAGLGEKITSFSLVQENILIGLFLYYFIGLIISRIGSLIFEPLFTLKIKIRNKKIRLVKFAKYEKYVNASKIDPKIELFSEINNMYRTLCALSVALILLKIYDGIEGFLTWNSDTKVLIFLIVLLVMFFLSYKKQTEKYVVKRVKIALKKEEE